MASCYSKKFIDICIGEWDYECGNNKWNKYADELDKIDYFTGKIFDGSCDNDWGRQIIQNGKKV